MGLDNEEQFRLVPEHIAVSWLNGKKRMAWDEDLTSFVEMVWDESKQLYVHGNVIDGIDPTSGESGVLTREFKNGTDGYVFNDTGATVSGVNISTITHYTLGSGYKSRLGVNTLYYNHPLGLFRKGPKRDDICDPEGD
ncbi:hypothetical protein K8R33_01470 [archaeon]|nr:hypothetical protein [archaeon]